jgi:hypothetical protein
MNAFARVVGEHERHAKSHYRRFANAPTTPRLSQPERSFHARAELRLNHPNSLVSKLDGSL